MHAAIVAQMLGQSFHFLLRAGQNLVPRLPHQDCPHVTTEVEDFFERHLDAIAEIIKEPEIKVVHGPRCRTGHREWCLSWRWPFVHTWISNAICCCDITAILRDHGRHRRLIEEIREALSSKHGYDLYAGFSQESRCALAPVAEADQSETAG